MLAQTVAFHARTRPEVEALIFEDQRLTWAALADRVAANATFCEPCGGGRDTIVAMVMKNSAAFIELIYALSHLGAVPLPVNYRLSADEVAYITGHAGAALVVADEEFTALAEATELPIVLLGPAEQRDSTRAFPDDAARVPMEHRQGSDLYRIMYTSGTTDRPKGVTHTYDNFFNKSFAHIVTLGLTVADRLCIVGPLYHVGGCDLPGLTVHMCGGTIVLLRDYDPAAVAATIEAEAISGIWLAPVMTNGLLQLKGIDQFDCTSLRWCIGGGERTPETRIRAFMRTFPNARYVDAYGMTETLSGDTFMEPGFEIAKIGSVGRPVPMLEVEIRDDAGCMLPSGSEGEICMRGAKVMQGYWRDADRTAEAMWPDGFFRSGDVGVIDEDGFLFLTDRKKDMIISGGENISSSEVERVIYEMPEVREVAVIGRPDPQWGETPIAFVVLNEGLDLPFARLDAHCRSRLAGFKCPKAVTVVEALPRNPSGKILKRLLHNQV